MINKEKAGATKKEKKAAYDKRWFKNNPQKRVVYNRKSQLKTRYGISLEQFAEMVDQINSQCPICKSELIFGTMEARTAVIDHNHDTNRVRGIICNNCNRALGFLPNKEVLLSAVAYLDQNDI